MGFAEKVFDANGLTGLLILLALVSAATSFALLVYIVKHERTRKRCDSDMVERSQNGKGIQPGDSHSPSVETLRITKKLESKLEEHGVLLHKVDRKVAVAQEAITNIQGTCEELKNTCESQWEQLGKDREDIASMKGHMGLTQGG